MGNKRMNHVFNEMVVKDGRDIDTAELHFINGGISATFFCTQQAIHAAHAINNHDRLTEENKQQRESLDAFRELVKAQTKTIHDLNEENTALQRENADLKDKTLKLTTTMYQLRDYLSDIEYDLDQADSVFTLKDEIALIDETLTIRKE